MLLAKKEKKLQNNHHGSDLMTKQDFEDIFDQLESLEDIIFVIVEGFLLFCDRDVCANLDNKFFVTASKHVLKKRRESRPGYKTLQGKVKKRVFLLKIVLNFDLQAIGWIPQDILTRLYIHSISYGTVICWIQTP